MLGRVLVTARGELLGGKLYIAAASSVGDGEQGVGGACRADGVGIPGHVILAARLFGIEMQLHPVGLAGQLPKFECSGAEYAGYQADQERNPPAATVLRRLRVPAGAWRRQRRGRLFAVGRGRDEGGGSDG